jgi:hypothetical protein
MTLLEQLPRGILSLTVSFNLFLNFVDPFFGDALGVCLMPKYT